MSETPVPLPECKRMKTISPAPETKSKINSIISSGLTFHTPLRLASTRNMNYTRLRRFSCARVMLHTIATATRHHPRLSKYSSSNFLINIILRLPIICSTACGMRLMLTALFWTASPEAMTGKERGHCVRSGINNILQSANVGVRMCVCPGCSAGYIASGEGLPPNLQEGLEKLQVE